ncbi:MAG: hypothetical protein NZ473_06490 [Candidatus Kapabacteria bacterium]|nr:hypothetical protein [Candidatus Kapabacteria bacterium]MDW8225636.1 DUF6580 family putative transport protein [Bacteroidota bacterium]
MGMWGRVTSGKRGFIIAVLIFTAALTRLLPHPPNFTPITAMALLGGATLPLSWAYLIVFGAMIVSDVMLGILAADWTITLHPTLPAVYGSFALTTLLSHLFLRRHLRVLRLAGVTLAASLLFFAVTNFTVWLLGTLYPKTWAGLLACYVAALPFFRNSLLGDYLYTAVLFGAYGLIGHLLGYSLQGEKAKEIP